MFESPRARFLSSSWHLAVQIEIVRDLSENLEKPARQPTFFAEERRSAAKNTRHARHDVASRPNHGPNNCGSCMASRMVTDVPSGSSSAMNRTF